MTGRPLRAALWVRVSTTDQCAANQEPELRALAASRGLEVVQIYRLEGASAWSGSGGYREMQGAMLRDSRRGQFSVLLVWALDRLSREGPLATLQLVDRLGRAGVTVVSLHEPWTEAGGELRELLLAITAWVARMESQRRSDRTRAGLERARAGGTKIGRPLGAKDRRKRRRSGYFARWARERGE